MTITFHDMNISKFKLQVGLQIQCRMQVANQFPCFRIGGLAIPLFFAFAPVNVMSSDDQLLFLCNNLTLTLIIKNIFRSH